MTLMSDLVRTPTNQMLSERHLPLRQRALSRINRTETCWFWTGTLDTLGYGVIGHNYQHLCAHRVVYELLRGPIPEGLDLDHLCRNRACVNPEHLEPVTHAENVRRGVAPTALNAAKTSCIHGHPFEGANLWIDVRGRRHCRRCHADRAAKYRKARRAQ